MRVSSYFTRTMFNVEIAFGKVRRLFALQVDEHC